MQMVPKLTRPIELPSREFVTCCDCPDFDLCLNCFRFDEHGHNPSHTFTETTENSVGAEVEALLRPGRGVRHEALCDGCDQVSTVRRITVMTN